MSKTLFDVTRNYSSFRDQYDAVSDPQYVKTMYPKEYEKQEGIVYTARIKLLGMLELLKEQKIITESAYVDLVAEICKTADHTANELYLDSINGEAWAV